MSNISQSNRYTLIIPFFVAMITAVAIILVFSTGKLVTLAVIGSILFPLTLYLSGNPRLFFLFGLILASPLGLSLNFKTLIHIGGAPSYSIDLADFFLLPLLIFQIRDLIVGYTKSYHIPSIIYWWLGLVALGVFSIVVGPLRHLAGFETVRMIKCILLFLVIVNECKRVRHFEIIVLALIMGICLQFFVGLLQFILTQDLGLQAFGEASSDALKGANLGVYLTTESVYRVGALLGHPNLLSAYLALLLPILIALIFTGYNKFLKVLLSLIIIASCLLLLLTLSRSGWVAFAIAFAFLITFIFFDRSMRNRHKTIKGFLVIFTLIIIFAASGPMIKRLTQSDKGALDFRFEWAMVAVKMIQEKPLLGFGLNSFVYEMAPYTEYSNVKGLIKNFGEHWPAVHNIYLLVWSEQGTIGILLFFAFHFHLFRIALKNQKYCLDERIHMINIGAACGIIALLIDGMASFFIRVPAPGRIFWIVVALIVAIYNWNIANYKHRAALPTKENKV